MKNFKTLFGVTLFIIISSCSTITTEKNIDIFGEWNILGIDKSEALHEENDFNIIFLIETIKDNNYTLSIDSNSITVSENGLVIEKIEIHEINNNEINYSKESNSKLKEGIIKYQKIDNDNFNFLFSNGFKYKLQRIR